MARQRAAARVVASGAFPTMASPNRATACPTSERIPSHTIPSASSRNPGHVNTIAVAELRKARQALRDHLLSKHSSAHAAARALCSPMIDRSDVGMPCDEFIAHARTLSLGLSDQQLRLLYASMDADGDGCLRQQEVQQALLDEADMLGSPAQLVATPAHLAARAAASDSRWLHSTPKQEQNIASAVQDTEAAEASELVRLPDSPAQFFTPARAAAAACSPSGADASPGRTAGAEHQPNMLFVDQRLRDPFYGGQASAADSTKYVKAVRGQVLHKLESKYGAVGTPTGRGQGTVARFMRLVRLFDTKHRGFLEESQLRALLQDPHGLHLSLPPAALDAAVSTAIDPTSDVVTHRNLIRWLLEDSGASGRLLPGPGQPGSLRVVHAAGARPRTPTAEHAASAQSAKPASVAPAEQPAPELASPLERRGRKAWPVLPARSGSSKPLPATPVTRQRPVTAAHLPVAVLSDGRAARKPLLARVYSTRGGQLARPARPSSAIHTSATAIAEANQQFEVDRHASPVLQKRAAVFGRLGHEGSLRRSQHSQSLPALPTPSPMRSSSSSRLVTPGADLRDARRQLWS